MLLMEKRRRFKRGRRPGQGSGVDVDDSAHGVCGQGRRGTRCAVNAAEISFGGCIGVGAAVDVGGGPGVKMGGVSGDGAHRFRSARNDDVIPRPIRHQTVLNRCYHGLQGMVHCWVERFGLRGWSVPWPGSSVPTDQPTGINVRNILGGNGFVKNEFRRPAMPGTGNAAENTIGPRALTGRPFFLRGFFGSRPSLLLARVGSIQGKPLVGNQCLASPYGLGVVQDAAVGVEFRHGFIQAAGRPVGPMGGDGFKDVGHRKNPCLL